MTPEVCQSYHGVSQVNKATTKYTYWLYVAPILKGMTENDKMWSKRAGGCLSDNQVWLDQPK